MRLSNKNTRLYGFLKPKLVNDHQFMFLIIKLILTKNTVSLMNDYAVYIFARQNY
jgi:hypothetical protein